MTINPCSRAHRRREQKRDAKIAPLIAHLRSHGWQMKLVGGQWSGVHPARRQSVFVWPDGYYDFEKWEHWLPYHPVACHRRDTPHSHQPDSLS